MCENQGKVVPLFWIWRRRLMWGNNLCSVNVMRFAHFYICCFRSRLKWATLTRSGASTARTSARWVSTPWPWRTWLTNTGPRRVTGRAASNGAAGTIPCHRLPLRVNDESDSSSTRRLFRLRSVCQEYFLNGGMKRMLEKDEKSAKFAAGVTGSSVGAQPFSATTRSVLTSHSNCSAL